MATSFENTRNDEYAVALLAIESLHFGENLKSMIMEATASTRGNEGNPTVNICLGNFVEQFTCKVELATGCV